MNSYVKLLASERASATQPSLRQFYMHRLRPQSTAGQMVDLFSLYINAAAQHSLCAQYASYGHGRVYAEAASIPVVARRLLPLSSLTKVEYYHIRAYSMLKPCRVADVIQTDQLHSSRRKRSPNVWSIRGRVVINCDAALDVSSESSSCDDCKF